MKKLLLFIMVVSVGLFTANAQSPEVGPASDAPNGQQDALFDVLFITDIGSTGQVGVDGLAGGLFFNNEYWISAWASDLIHSLDSSGNFVETFSIPGLSGTRSMTTDGTNIYIGTAGLSIFEVDHATRMVTNIINVTTGSDAEARMVTYDETLDGGNGGFWIGDFGSDIASLDMNGNELSVIPSGTHNTVIYGGAIDNVSPGGPFLWISDQSGAVPSRLFLTQLDPATGVPTGVVYDFTADGGAAGATEVLAGGLMISADASPGTIALVGVCQCSPSNLLYALELIPDLGVGDNDISGFTLFPNPANGDIVNINTSISGEKQVAVFDVLGKKVMDVTIDNELNISTLSPGIYMVRVTQNNSTATKKLIVN